MNRLRLVLVVVAVAVVVVGGWSGGDDKNPPAKAPTLPHPWNRLNLSDEQAQVAHKVRAAYKAKLDALKKEERAELEKILTPAQKDRLQKMPGREPKARPSTGTAPGQSGRTLAPNPSG
jgi:hypothetical protein